MLGRSGHLLDKLRGMLAAFSILERRKNLRLLILLNIVAIDRTPSWIQYRLSSGLELQPGHISNDCCRRILTRWVEHGNETLCDQVIYLVFRVTQVWTIHTCRYDGMMVCHLGSVENTAAFRQWLHFQWLDE